MGRRYTTPPDTNEKEKIVGGVLTFQQTAYIIIGVGIGAVFFLISFFLINIYIAAILLVLCSFVIGPVLAFYKVDGYALDEYLILSNRHKKNGRKLPFLRNVG